MPFIRPRSRSRWSISALRWSANVRSLFSHASPRAAAQSPRASGPSISPTRASHALPGLPARDARRRQQDRRPRAHPGTRNDDGAVRAGRLDGGALGRADHHGGGRMMGSVCRVGKGADRERYLVTRTVQRRAHAAASKPRRGAHRPQKSTRGHGALASACQGRDFGPRLCPPYSEASR